MINISLAYNKFIKLIRNGVYTMTDKKNDYIQFMVMKKLYKDGNKQVYL